MEYFSSLAAGPALPDRLVDGLRACWESLAAPGTWWAADEQVEAARIARAAFADRFSPPWNRPEVERALAESQLDRAVGEIIVRLAADASAIDRSWAETSIDSVGEGAYVELVAIAASIAVADAFSVALGVAAEPLPAPTTGAPSRVRPDGMGDIGAYVVVDTTGFDANVGRALTLSPTANRLYRQLAVPFYHDGQFLDLAWERSLSRPQTEVLATAVSAANECFY